MLDFSVVGAEDDFLDFFEEWCFERRLWPPRLLELLLLLALLESEEADDDEDEDEEVDDDEEDEDDELEEERERFFLGRFLVSSSLEDFFLSSPVLRFLAFSLYSSWWDDLRFLLPLPADGSSRLGRAADLLLV